MHEISLEKEKNSIIFGTLGGDIYLNKNKEMPKCTECNKEMSLYLQIDIKEEFNTPFITGSKFNVFCCPEHDEVPDGYSNLDKEVLPAYGKENHGHYSITLTRPEDIEKKPISKEKVILEKNLYAVAKDEEIRECEYVGLTSENYGFKIGGTPSWMNYSANLKCTCGSEIKYLFQIPDSYDFFYGDGPVEYHSLFLSNQIVFMACESQCSPYSVITVCDN